VKEDLEKMATTAKEGLARRRAREKEFAEKKKERAERMKKLESSWNQSASQRYRNSSK